MRTQQFCVSVVSMAQDSGESARHFERDTGTRAGRQRNINEFDSWHDPMRTFSVFLFIFTSQYYYEQFYDWKTF